MKILQVNCVYKKGSTGKIVSCIHESLKSKYDMIVCYGRGEKIREPKVYKTCGEIYSKINNTYSRLTGTMYGGCSFSTERLISIIKKENPDIVHLHCINGYFVNIYTLISWMKNNRIKTVLTLHAEFMYTANCGHALDCEKWKTGCGHCPRFRRETKSLFFDRTAESWRRMNAAFEGFEQDCLIVSVSPWLMERAKQSPILSKFRHEVVLNGLDTEVFRPTESDIRTRYGIRDDQALILHVTPSFSLEEGSFKGGWYVVQMARRMPSCFFAIAGCREKNVDLPSNVINIGYLANQRELSSWYTAADATLLTSRKETFSMVTTESLCCGTPVAGFKAGAPEQIALKEYSCFVEYGDIEALEKGIEEIITHRFRKDIISTLALDKYSSISMCKKYANIYTQILR